MYASPTLSIRRHLWARLNQLYMEGLSLLIGDFNCVLKGKERSTGDGVSTSFVNWMNQRGLLDLGFSGSPFTWHHGLSVDTCLFARLGPFVMWNGGMSFPLLLSNISHILTRIIAR